MMIKKINHYSQYNYERISIVLCPQNFWFFIQSSHSWVFLGSCYRADTTLLHMRRSLLIGVFVVLLCKNNKISEVKSVIGIYLLFTFDIVEFDILDTRWDNNDYMWKKLLELIQKYFAQTTESWSNTINFILMNYKWCDITW